jgi:Domain of unknown function (DUF4389)
MTTTATTISAVDGAPVPPALLVEPIRRRGRLSVAFRLLLVLPQAVALYVLSLVGVVVVLLGWLAALVLGRLPAPFARYLAHLTSYATRVNAYLWLLTDRYPPFRLLADDYPVRVELAPGRLNRLAVLFRLLLAIPAAILSSLATGGWLVSSFVIWLLVLVLGRVPGALFDATTAVLRYSMRYTAYSWLVTAAYPWGLFGDRPALGAAVDAGPAEEAPPRPGLLVLSGGAKLLVALFLVLGVVELGAAGAASVVTAGNLRTTTEARSDFTAAYDTLTARIQQYQQQVADCGARPELACVQAADAELAGAFEAFGGELRRIEFPASARDEAAELERRTDRIAGVFGELSTAGGPREYERLASSTQQLGNEFDRQAQAVAEALSGTGAPSG